MFFCALFLLGSLTVAAPNPQSTHAEGALRPALPAQRAEPYSIDLPSPISGATDRVSIAIDATGRMHVSFNIAFGGQVIYATCATSCDDPNGWTSVQVGSHGAYGARPLIKVLADGRPRIVYMREDSGSAGLAQLIYNACESDCTTGASWIELPVQDVTVPSGETLASRYFELDAQGRPRVIVPGPNSVLFYFECNTGCSANAANWFYIGLTRAVGAQPAITIDNAGQPHVLYRTTDTAVSPDNDVLAYATCAQNCLDQDSWIIGNTFLVGRGYQSKYAIETDSSNRPRIALHTGSLVISDTTQANALIYAWCDGSCEMSSSWNGTLVGTEPRDGFAPDLALDSAGRPHISYLNDDSGYQIGYATCTAACETSSPSWTDRHLESPLSYPKAPAPGCAFPFWYVISPTSIALDASGNPRIVFGARLLQTCSTIRETLRRVRYIDVGVALAPTLTPTPGPGTPSATPVPTRTPTPTATIDFSQLTLRTYLPVARR